jgi:glucose-1-phosphate cytidylyltransferase
VTYGDTLSSVDLNDLLLFHASHEKTGTLLAVHNPTRFRILGLADDDDVIRGFSEKPVLERDYINGGFYIFNSAIFDAKALSSSSSCVLETAVLEELISRKQLLSYRHDGFWQSLDNERDRNKLAAYVRESASESL